MRGGGVLTLGAREGVEVLESGPADLLVDDDLLDRFADRVRLEGQPLVVVALVLVLVAAYMSSGVRETLLRIMRLSVRG